MAVQPVAHVTDTYFIINDWSAFTRPPHSAWDAIQEWCRKHGIDPVEVLAAGPIHRDVERCRVVFVGRVGGDLSHPEHDLPDQVWADFPPGWSTVYRQGETPPLPWPAELDPYRTAVPV